MNLNQVDVSKLPSDVRKQYKQLQVMHAERKIQNKAKNDDGFFKERCLKHLQTFTSRSHVLKLGKSQAKIKWFAQNAEIENGFYEHINSAGIGDNHFKDGAPLTSKNRIRFSKEHWNDFKNENDVKKHTLYEKFSNIILFDSKGYEKSMSFDHKLIKDLRSNTEIMLAGDIQIDDDLENYNKITDIIDISLSGK